jgi:hypothetical protein
MIPGIQPRSNTNSQIVNSTSVASARHLFAELENNQASKSLFNDQSLVILVDSGKKASREIKHDCLVHLCLERTGRNINR